MTAIAWFLSEAAFPVSLGVAFAVAVSVARHRPVRHYRRRNRRFLQQVHEMELRSRTRGGGSEAADDDPQRLSAAAGSERGVSYAVCAPPATQALVGAVAPRSAAPTRLRVRGVS